MYFSYNDLTHGSICFLRNFSLVAFGALLIFL